MTDPRNLRSSAHEYTNADEELKTEQRLSVMGSPNRTCAVIGILTGPKVAVMMVM